MTNPTTPAHATPHPPRVAAAPLQVPDKLPGVGTTIFTVMSARAAAVGAVNLGQGFPDFAPDAHLLDLVAEAMRRGHNQYAPMPGLPALRGQLSDLFARIYGLRYDADAEVTVTSGATEALFDAVAAITRPGDEVIVLEPCYDCYVPAIELAGGIAVRSKLVAPHYGVDWADVRAKITPRTRVIMINTPHNPTGAVWSRHDLDQLHELTHGTNIAVISDEVYEHIVFDDHLHHGVATHSALAARSFLIGSFGKSLHVTGWKMGFCLAPAALSAAFRKVHQFVTFASNHPIQWAIAEYLKQWPHFNQQIRSFYQHKRDLFAGLMAATPFVPLPTHGTYFQLYKYDNISTLPDTEFALWLTERHGVACIPMSVFYGDATDHHIVRFCFAKEDATLRAAAQRLSNIQPHKT
jgi:methionine aminotransferase